MRPIAALALLVSAMMGRMGPVGRMRQIATTEGPAPGPAPKPPVPTPARIPPMLRMRPETKPRQWPAPLPPPVVHRPKVRTGYDEKRSLAALIGTAESIDEVNLYLEEAERALKDNPKALHKCRRKAAARRDCLLPVPF